MGSIYCLFSSKDSEPRYVGETSRDPGRRWKEHIANALDKETAGALCDWIRDVLRQGHLVQYWVLQDDVAPVDLPTFEAYWCRQFAGLLNCDVDCPERNSELGDAIVKAIRKAAKGQAVG